MPPQQQQLSYLAPSTSCASRSHAIHELADHSCTAFYRTTFVPWLASVGASDSAGCVSLRLPPTGLGNWLPHVLVALETSVLEQRRLRLVRLGSVALFDAIGLQRLVPPSSCSSSIDVGPGKHVRSRNMSYRCLWRLLVCPTAALDDRVRALRAQLPPQYAAIHARFGRDGFESEGRLLDGLRVAFEAALASSWRDARDTSLSDAARVAGFDALVSRATPPLCAAACATATERAARATSTHDELSRPRPFVCCGNGTDTQRLVSAAGTAAAATAGGTAGRFFLATDSIALLHFARRFMPDRLVTETRGAPMYSGGAATKLRAGGPSSPSSNASADDDEREEREGALKIATDLLMLAGARVVVPLNPSSFARVGAAIGPWGATPNRAEDRLGQSASLLHGVAGRAACPSYGHCGEDTPLVVI